MCTSLTIGNAAAISSYLHFLDTQTQIQWCGNIVIMSLWSTMEKRRYYSTKIFYMRFFWIVSACAYQSSSSSSSWLTAITKHCRQFLLRSFGRPIQHFPCFPCRDFGFCLYVLCLCIWVWLAQNDANLTQVCNIAQTMQSKLLTDFFDSV